MFVFIVPPTAQRTSRSAIMRVVILLTLVAVALAANSGRSHSSPLLSCKSIGTLPLVVDDDTECYELTRDLEWDDISPAITWNGAKRGELHFRGYSLTLATQCARGVLVAGGGDLTVFDAWVASPTQQYCMDGRGFQASNNSTLTLYDALLSNLNVAVVAFDSMLRVERAQITGTPNAFDGVRANYVTRLSGDGAGVACLGASVCHIEDTHVRFSQTPDPDGVAIQTIGFDRVSSNFSTHGEIHIYRSSAVAHQCFNMAGGHAAALHDCVADVLPSIGDAGDPLNQLVIGFGYRMGCQRIEQAVVRGCQANLERVSTLAAVAAMEVVATGSLIVDGFNVVGRSPLSDITYFSPPIRRVQKGLIFVSPICNNANQSSVHLRNLQTTATEPSTVHIAVGTDTVGMEPGEPMVMIENWIGADGGVGVVVGSGSRRSVRIRAAQLNRQYYGVYMVDGASNVVIRDTTFTQHCVAVRAEAASSNLIVRETEFQDNSDALDISTGSFISMNNYNTGDTSAPCGPAPFIYDSA